MSRVDALVNALQVMCMIEPLSFDRLNQRATAMQMPVVSSFETLLPTGGIVRSKTWVMGMTNGPLAFSAGDSKDTPRVRTTCGISAPDTTMDEMQAALSASLHLQEPRTIPAREGGSAILIWDTGLGAEAKMVLTAGRFKPQPGFNLVYEMEPAHTGEAHP